MDTNRDSANQSQNEDNFPTFSLGLDFLNEADMKVKHNGKGDSASAPSPAFASLSEGECNKFWQKGTGKTKQMTNWSVWTFTGKLKFLRFSRRIWWSIPPAML